jgi:hypothetical protein
MAKLCFFERILPAPFPRLIRQPASSAEEGYKAGSDPTILKMDVSDRLLDSNLLLEYFIM